MMRRACTLAAALVLGAGFGGCGGASDGEESELGAMTCEEMQDEADELARTFQGKLRDLSEYRYVAERIDAPVATVLPGRENEGWTTWFIYYCSQDFSQTAEEAFDRGQEVVEESGGPEAAQERYLRIVQGKEQPPP